MDENECISIFVKNLSVEEIFFLDAVVIPRLVNELMNCGLEVARVDCVFNGSKKLCNGKCEHCVFEEVCSEREVA